MGTSKLSAMKWIGVKRKSGFLYKIENSQANFLFLIRPLTNPLLFFQMRSILKPGTADGLL